MAKKILIVTGDGGECYETLYALHRFEEAGYDAVIAATAKRPLNLVMHDFEPGWDTYIERPGYKVESHVGFDEVVVSEYEAVVFVGGRAPEYLRHNDQVVAMTKSFHAADKWIFAICHGIQVLVAADLVKGRQLTCYEHIRSEMEMAGGTFCTEEAVRDGKFVTGQTWQSHPDFYRLVFDCLEGR